jgi:homoserine O-succinyltransferase
MIGVGLNCIDIALINNMPSAALEATERQFRTVLDAAAGNIKVRLTLYTLPDVPRTDAGKRYVSSCYADISDLWNSHVDGIIVTGTEPRAPNLEDEPYWGSLTRLLDWAEHQTYSSIWSCLAAHAAVLHMNGIGRRPLRDKSCGVFECARVSDHPLASTVPVRFQMPHSRWNEVPEDSLISCGYHILTRADNAGADAFLKQSNSLFVFFQGHPEYEAETLLLEYRRDVGRFLRRERDKYPSTPQGYFDEDTTRSLTVLRNRALSDRREELLADLSTVLAASKVKKTWGSAAVCLYRNWLQYLCGGQRRMEYKPVRAVAVG